jgi:hypothetical protein
LTARPFAESFHVLFKRNRFHHCRTDKQRRQQHRHPQATSQHLVILSNFSHLITHFTVIQRENLNNQTFIQIRRTQNSSAAERVCEMMGARKVTTVFFHLSFLLYIVSSDDVVFKKQSDVPITEGRHYPTSKREKKKEERRKKKEEEIFFDFPFTVSGP